MTDAPMTDTQAGLLPEADDDIEFLTKWAAMCGSTSQAIRLEGIIARLKSPSPPASAEVDAVLSCKASELQEYGCACRWEGMKLADICDAHKEAFKASGAAVQVPEPTIRVKATYLFDNETRHAEFDLPVSWLPAAPQKQGA